MKNRGFYDIFLEKLTLNLVSFKFKSIYNKKWRRISLFLVLNESNFLKFFQILKQKIP